MRMLPRSPSRRIGCSSHRYEIPAATRVSAAASAPTSQVCQGCQPGVAGQATWMSTRTGQCHR